MSLLKSLKGLYKGWDGELTVKLMQWMHLWIMPGQTGAGVFFPRNLVQPMVG